MGEIKHVLAEGKYQADALPYSGRLVIEDCVGETVHVHVGHVRLEFTPEQFLWLSDRMREAGSKYRRLHGLPDA